MRATMNIMNIKSYLGAIAVLCTMCPVLSIAEDGKLQKIKKSVAIKSDADKTSFPDFGEVKVTIHPRGYVYWVDKDNSKIYYIDNNRNGVVDTVIIEGKLSLIHI